GQQAGDRAPVGREVGAAQFRLGVGGGQPGSVQQLVGVAQVDVKRFSQPQNHVTAGPGAAGFQEGDVPRCRAGGAGEGKLAEPVVLAPWAQPGTERAGRCAGLAGHDRQCARAARRAAIPFAGIAKPAAARQPGDMQQLAADLTIDAPADRVWEVIGPGFARIGEWASVIPASTAIPGPGGPAGAAGAPVTGRVCATGVPLMPRVTETLIAYDQARRTLTYQARGLPA